MIIFSPYIIKNDPAARYICDIFTCTLGGRAECTTCAMRFHFKPQGFQGLGTTHLPSLWKAEIAPLGREMTLIHTSCTHTHTRTVKHSLTHTLCVSERMKKRVALGRGIPWFQSGIPLKVHECVCLGIKTPALLLLLSRQLCTCVCVCVSVCYLFMYVVIRTSCGRHHSVVPVVSRMKQRRVGSCFISGSQVFIRSLTRPPTSSSTVCTTSSQVPGQETIYSRLEVRSLVHEFHVAFLSH